MHGGRSRRCQIQRAGICFERTPGGPEAAGKYHQMSPKRLLVCYA
ncbi:MAG: hypothetical protein QOK48_454 [Blastocatellia bacterium]|nr:hypothetical protein [Blastocatellia bacterium]